MTQFIGLRDNEADYLVFISYIVSDRDAKLILTVVFSSVPHQTCNDTYL